MPIRLSVLGLALLVCLPLAAQAAQFDSDDDDDSDSRVELTIELQVSQHGTLRATVYSYKLPAESVPAALKAIPVSGAQWTVSHRDGDVYQATCLNCLRAERIQGEEKTELAQLRLAPFVEALRSDYGIADIWIAVSLQQSAKEPAPEGWKSSDSSSGWSYATFHSPDESELPPDLRVPVQPSVQLWSVLVPLGGMLIVPAGLAYAIRRRATNASAGQKVNWMVWMHWINLGAWLYWITAVSPGDTVEILGGLALSNSLAAIAAGVALWSLPPLTAIAACLAVMSPLLTSSAASFGVLLKRHVLSQATVLVPLGIFLIGSEVSAARGYQGAIFATLVGAYVVYRILVWFTWTASYAEVQPVESGALFERAGALARKAGVTISRLGVLRTRVPQEVNAFAMAGGRIVLTESLLTGLTPREVDAVIAHELGHHKAGHLRVNWARIAFWVYLLGAGPLFGWLIVRFHLPVWFVTVPITPLLFTLLQALLSQRGEFTADARAAEITGDPEGTIAALARIAQLSRVPAGNQGIMGSIMSHPSMENRVLALARRHNLPDQRALEILTNPDAAYSGVARPEQTLRALDVPGAASTTPAVFTLRAKAGFIEQLGWLRLLVPLSGALLLAVICSRFMELPDPRNGLALVLLAIVPLLAWQLACDYFAGSRFTRRIRAGLIKTTGPQPGAMFVGLHPGSGLRYTEGYSEWDFGFLTFEGDWLCYRGEKTRFALSRPEVHRIEVISGRPSWFRQRRVEIAYSGGVFTITRNSTFATLADANRTARIVSKWAKNGGALISGLRPEPAPSLPQLPGIDSSRWRVAWLWLTTTFKLWIAGPMILMASSHNAIANVLGVAILMFSAPVSVGLRLLPGVIWPIRRPKDKEAAVAQNPVPQAAPLS